MCFISQEKNVRQQNTEYRRIASSIVGKLCDAEKIPRHDNILWLAHSSVNRYGNNINDSQTQREQDRQIIKINNGQRTGKGIAPPT